MPEPVAVIVGAGQAGAYAAVAAREAGFAGPILLLGEEPHRPYERPPLSKSVLTEAEAPEPGWFHAADRYTALDIDLRMGVRVVGIDAAEGRVVLGDGQRLAYDRLVLATGGRARHLPVPGGERALVLRTLEDARALRARLRPGARVVCIGAGVIGLEVAASARALGCEVAVVEAAPRALGRGFTAEIAAWVERLHRDRGVALHFGAGVQAVEPDAVICDGARLPADIVVAGIGIIRNAELAAEAGATLDGGGIAVDEFGRTSLDHVYAAGDVAAFWHPRLGRRLRLESWRHAQDHGIAVGRAVAGATEAYAPVPWFWTDQHGVTIQVAGLVEDATHTVLRGEETAQSFCAFHLDDEGRVVAATGVNAAREVRVATALIHSGRVIDPAMLADPAVKLQALAKAAA